MTPVEDLLSKLRKVFNEEGVSIWLASAIAQGWAMEECLRRVEDLRQGSFS